MMILSQYHIFELDTINIYSVHFDGISRFKTVELWTTNTRSKCLRVSVVHYSSTVSKWQEFQRTKHQTTVSVRIYLCLRTVGDLHFPTFWHLAYKYIIWEKTPQFYCCVSIYVYEIWATT